MNALTLTPGSLTLKQLRNVWRQPVTLSLDESAHAAINDSVACVEAIVAEGRTAYGINTGFGLLAQTRIATHDLENLQRSLVLSHAAGVGQPLDDEIRPQVPVSPSPVSLRWNRVVVTGADVGSFRYVATLNSSP